MNYRRRLFLACLEDRSTPAAGALDTTFGGDGRVTTSFLGATDVEQAAAVAIQPDGKIVAAGTIHFGGGATSDFALARYNPDGSLDGTFGSGGRTTLNFGFTADDEQATCVTIQDDGKIVVGGFATVGGDQDFVVARFNTDGTPDASFSSDGRTSFSFGGGGTNNDQAFGVTTQLVGGARKIVLAGTTDQGAVTGIDFGVVRFNDDGTVLDKFSKTAGGTDQARAVDVDSANNIVVGGFTNAFGTNDFVVMRFTPAGTFDATFNGGTPSTVNFGFDDQALAMKVAAGDKIVIAGFVDAGAADFGVARLKSDGTVDTTFNPTGDGAIGSAAGRFTFNFGSAGIVEHANGLALQSDGRIVLAGFTALNGTGTNPNDFAVARVTADGKLDTTFDTDGLATVDFGGDDRAAGVALDANGRIVAAGSTGAAADFALARLTGNEVDLTVTVTDGSPSVVAGGSVTYTVTVTNAGPDVAVGSKVASVIPSGLTGVTFTSTASGGATGNTNGAGAINDTLTLPAGASVTYTVTGTVALTAAGPLAFTASAAAPSGAVETTPADATATDTDVVIASPKALLVGGPTDGTAKSFLPAGGKYTGSGTTVSFFPAASKVNVRTAAADVNGDGVADLIGGTGPGVATNVTVVDGKTGATIASFQPFEASFTGGVFVATGDFDGDGLADLIVSPDQGGGPVIAIYDGALLTAGKQADAQVNRFFGIEDPDFRGGARAAAGDITGDGRADLVVSAGFLGGPRIAVFDGKGLNAGSATLTHLVPDFFAFENTLRNGAFVAVGDVNGDGRAELAFGGGPGGAPRVRVFDGADLVAAAPFSNVDAVPAAQVANFFAGDSSLRGGVRMTFKDVNADGLADLVTGSGEGEASRVRVFTAATLLGSASPTADQEFDPFGQTLANGVFVG